MDVNDVVVSALERVAKLFLEIPAERHSSLRAVEVHGLAASNADDVRLVDSTFEIRSDDVYVMAKSPRFTREKVNVLADAAEVWIVVLGDEGNPQGFCEIGGRRREGRSWSQIQYTRQVITTR